MEELTIDEQIANAFSQLSERARKNIENGRLKAKTMTADDLKKEHLNIILELVEIERSAADAINKRQSEITKARVYAQWLYAFKFISGDEYRRIYKSKPDIEVLKY